MIQIDHLKIEAPKRHAYENLFKIYTPESVRYAHVASEINNYRYHDMLLPDSNIEILYVNPENGEIEGFECRYYRKRENVKRFEKNVG